MDTNTLFDPVTIDAASVEATGDEVDIEAWLCLVAAAGLPAATIAEAMVGDGLPQAQAQALAAAAVIRHNPLGLRALLADDRGHGAAVLLRRWICEATTSSPPPQSLPVSALLDPARIECNRLVLPDRSVDVLALSRSPRLAVFGNLLSADECDALIALARDRLHPDTVVNHDTAEADGVLDTRYRSSDGCSLHACDGEVVGVLDARVRALIGEAAIPEALSLSRYLPGQAFSPHHDYFEPGEKCYAKFTEGRGQRVATLVMYLSEVEGGGGTVFPDLDVEVRPQRGGATYFTYQREDGSVDPSSLHGGAPVLSGEKWIATVWFRERIAP